MIQWKVSFKITTVPSKIGLESGLRRTGQAGTPEDDVQWCPADDGHESLDIQFLALSPCPLYISRKIYYGQLRFKDQNDHLSDSFTHFKLIAEAFFEHILFRVIYYRTLFSFKKPFAGLSAYYPLEDYPFDQLKLFWSNKSVQIIMHQE